jgi:hypothetical protein
MDFGDILDEWDRQTAAARGKKAVSRKKTAGGGEGSERDGRNDSGGGSLKRTDPLTRWLRVNGVYDKDAEGESAELSPGDRRRRLLAKRPDALIDLHGLTRDEAWNSLEIFFRDSRNRGLEKILIIHGKGNHSGQEGVLKETVRTYIERCPFAGESGRGSAALGGGGATWVFLKP